MALKGMEPAPNPQNWGGSKKLEGGSFKFVTPAPQHEGKRLNRPRQNKTNIKTNHATQKTQRQTQGPTGLYELFLLTVSIEEVARWQYIKQFW